MAVRASQARGRQAGAHRFRCLSIGPSPTAANTAHEGAAAVAAAAAAAARTNATRSGSDYKRDNSRRALSFASGARSASRGVACFASTNSRQSATLASRCIDGTTRRSKATNIAASAATTAHSHIRGGDGDASGGKLTSSSADDDIFHASGFSGGSRRGANNPTDLSVLRVVPSSRSRSFGAPALLATRDTAASNFARVCTSSERRWRDGRVTGRGWGLNSGMPDSIGMSWRNFASASSPPEQEQYLRYIHRVKTPVPAEQRLEGLAENTSRETEERAPPDAESPNPKGTNERAVNGGGGSSGANGDGVPGSRPASSTVDATMTWARDRSRKDGSEDEEDAEGDAHTPEMTRKWLKGFTAEDILRDKTLLRQQLEVRGNTTVDEAVTAFVNERVTSFVVVNRRKEVIGMFTSRDLLAELAKFPEKADGLKSKAHEFMIPLSQMIYCSPADSLYQCLLVMSELKVRNLPVVSEGKVMGIVNVNDISDFSFSMEELGGKKAYIKNISQRKGLPKGVGLDPRQNRSGWKQAFSASVGAVAIPHPHKMPNGALSANQREHRHLEIAEDSTLSEDAYFVLDVTWPTATTDTVHYVGLADGVGSWRKLGVDPRDFSHRLMHWASQYIMSMAPDTAIGAHLAPPPPKPHQVLRAAWEYTIGEKIVGSSTACIAALDYDLEQLTFSNIGDCGVVVLRHIDSDVAGYMREKKTPRYLRDNDLRLAFISQQQLRSFNLPYQFGYTNVPEDNANFETPRDAVNTSFPVRPGDIVLLATDGLFDNMELDDICSVALSWEYKWFGGPKEGLSEHNNAAMEDLAQQLGRRARELSLDNTRDSPFALLAKENDIMWGGGMPDDITIVALRVINKAQSSAGAISTRGVGPDDRHADDEVER